MKILFTICGRAGSKGIKNKNIRTFLGIPLPIYTLSTLDLYLKKNPHIMYDIALNTDSTELMKIFANSNLRKAETIYREEKLAGDTVSKIAVIRDSWEKMLVLKGDSYDMVVDLDITSPLRTVIDLENLIRVKNETGCDVAFTVTDARRNPYFNMVKKCNRGYSRVITSDFSTRQEAPEIYDMNASIYAYAPQYLKTGREIYEGYCEVSKMYDTAILDLDHENDFELMEVIAEYLFNTINEYREIYRNCLLEKG